MALKRGEKKFEGKIAIVSLTAGGRAQAQKIVPLFENADNYVTAKYDKVSNEKFLPNSQFKLALQQLFKEYDALICIMATGIVVRSLAPVLVDKQYDPAVLVMDEKGQHIISLLSGHLGGANQLARQLADHIDGRAVITTATDTQNVTALDLLAKEISGHYSSFKENTKLFNSLLADCQKVGIYQDGSWVSDFRGLTIIDDLKATDPALTGIIIVSPYKQFTLPETLPVVHVIPKRLVLGMGSRKNVSSEQVFEAFTQFCELHHLEPASICKIVSINLKKNEKGLLALADTLNCPFETFSADTLAEAASYYPSSDFVKKQVGIGNVASASAHYETNGQVLTERFSYNGVTLVLSRK